MLLASSISIHPTNYVLLRFTPREGPRLTAAARSSTVAGARLLRELPAIKKCAPTANAQRFFQVRRVFQYAGVAISHLRTDISQSTNTKRAATHIPCRCLILIALLVFIVTISQSQLYCIKCGSLFSRESEISAGKIMPSFA